MAKNDQFLDQILNALQETRTVLTAQYRAILKEQISVDSRLCAIEQRLENLELKIDCNVQLEGFSMDIIQNYDDFINFLNRIKNEKDFRIKVVSTQFVLKIEHIISLN